MVRLEGLGKLNSNNDIVDTRTRDLPACSIAPEPSMLPRASVLEFKTSANVSVLHKNILHARELVDTKIMSLISYKEARICGKPHIFL
jgi:hypothetical protein